jgi:proteasome lid subunit RPN8/RPN11
MDEEGDRFVKLILPIINHREAEEQYHRFEVTPDDYMKAERAAMERGLDVIGFYHSHPNCEAVPSAYDLAHALPFHSYVIVSVINKDGAASAAELTSWRMSKDRAGFDHESVMVAGA